MDQPYDPTAIQVTVCYVVEDLCSRGHKDKLACMGLYILDLGEGE